MRQVDDQLRLEELRWREYFLAPKVLAADRMAEVLSLIADAPDRDSARMSLCDALGLELAQTEAVMTMQLEHFHADARRIRSDELVELRAEIDRLATLLAKPDSPSANS